MPARQARGDRFFNQGFGERLRQLREAYAEKDGPEHHTKAKWADMLWISPALYGRWETGEYMPHFVDLLRIAELFRVDHNYLIEGVLSPYLEKWLFDALLLATPQSLAEADYWKRRTVAFAKAKKALQDQKRRPK